MGRRGREWRKDEILKLGGDKSSIFPNTNRGWVAKGRGEDGGGSLLIYDKSENESQNHNAAKVDISCPNVSLNAFNCILSSVKINWGR